MRRGSGWRARPVHRIGWWARAVCLKVGVTAWPQIDFCTYDVEVTGAREIANYYRDGWLPA